MRVKDIVSFPHLTVVGMPSDMVLGDQLLPAKIWMVPCCWSGSRWASAVYISIRWAIKVLRDSSHRTKKKMALFLKSMMAKIQ